MRANSRNDVSVTTGHNCPESHGRARTEMTDAGRWVTRHPLATGMLVLALGGVAGCGASQSAPRSTTAVPASGATAASPSRPGPATDTTPVRTTVPTPRVTAAPVDRRQAGAHTAAVLLASLAIKGRAPKTGYSRAQFGSAWTDDTNAPGGHNGCDTRNDILARDLTHTVIKAGTGGCVVLTGTLHDPYTARTIAFTRGVSTSTRVQIDHVAALSDAWQKGAQQLSLANRITLANDPLELLAVDGPTNEAKGDGDAATWLPPNKAYRCAYVARQVAVKARYHLWVTQAEHDAITRVLAACPGQRAPTESDAPVIVSTPAAHATTGSPAAPSRPPDVVYYQNCSAVRAAGKAPLYRGQPGYAAHLDRDGDGIACEN